MAIRTKAMYLITDEGVEEIFRINGREYRGQKMADQLNCDGQKVWLCQRSDGTVEVSLNEISGGNYIVVPAGYGAKARHEIIANLLAKNAQVIKADKYGIATHFRFPRSVNFETVMWYAFA